MAEKSQQRISNLALIETFLQNLQIYQVDIETAYRYGQLKAEILRYFGPKDKGKFRRITIQNLGFSENDLWIAAVALRHNLTLVSADSDFMRLQQVRNFPLESWLS